MERKYIYCQNCGKKNDVGNEHCKKCGFRLSRISQPPQLVQTQLRTGGKSGQKTLFIVLGSIGGALLLAALVFAVIKTDVLGRLFDRRTETATSVSQTVSSPQNTTTAAATTVPATTAPVETVYNYTVNTQSSALNIRSGPGLTFADFGNIPKGAKVTVPVVFDGWGYVNYRGIDGFVSMQYLKRLGTPPSKLLGMPEVKQSFALNELHTFDDGVSVGFDVKLPQLNSNKPGAKDFNLLLAEYRADVEESRAQAGDLKDYDVYCFQRYGYTAYGNVLFVMIYSFYSYAYSEMGSQMEVYAYDFVADKQLSDAEVAALYGKTEKGVTAAVQKAFPPNEEGEDQPKDITGFSKFDLFVTNEGKLYAECTYKPIVFTWFFMADVS